MYTNLWQNSWWHPANVFLLLKICLNKWWFQPKTIHKAFRIHKTVYKQNALDFFFFYCYFFKPILYIGFNTICQKISLHFQPFHQSYSSPVKDVSQVHFKGVLWFAWAEIPGGGGVMGRGDAFINNIHSKDMILCFDKTHVPFSNSNSFILYIDIFFSFVEIFLGYHVTVDLIIIYKLHLQCRCVFMIFLRATCFGKILYFVWSDMAIVYNLAFAGHQVHQHAIVFPWGLKTLTLTFGGNWKCQS